MKILALETSAKSVSVAVTEDGVPLASSYQNTGLTHSRTLMPLLDAMLTSSGLELQDMDALAVGGGAGQLHGAAYRRLGAEGARVGGGEALLRRLDARDDGPEPRTYGRAHRLRDGRAAQSGL